VSITFRFLCSGLKTVVHVAIDKDMLQLVDDGIHIMHPYSYELLGKDHIFEKFGVLPSQICDLFALMGDAVVGFLFLMLLLASFFGFLLIRTTYQELQILVLRQQKC
jgi:hypothetical protein